MPVFVYSAIKNNGEKVKGEITLESEQQVYNKLISAEISAGH